MPADFAIAKPLAALPGTLKANTVYAVRVGTGFDLYITDSTGSIAYKQNAPDPALAPVSHATGDTLADSDAGKVAEMDGGTLYLDASVLTANYAGLIRQTGTTAVTVVAKSGTTIFPAGARTTAGKGCMLAWQVRSASLAYVNGETA